MRIWFNILKFVARNLPETRCYRTRVFLYRFCGFDIAANARIVASCRIIGTFNLRVGADAYIGHEVLITGGDSNIWIGDNVDIAPRVTIVCGTHKIDMLGRHSAGEGENIEIKIGNGSWIGAGSLILPGVTIGSHCVIGAGSVVVKSMPDYAICVGNPCKPIKFWDPASSSWLTKS